MDLPAEGLDFVSHKALNILAREVAGSGEAAVVLAGSHILGKEIHRRLKGPEVIWLPTGQSQQAGGKAHSPRKLNQWMDARNGPSGESSALVLACPLGEGYHDGWGEILAGLPSAHSLHVLAYGWLSRLRPEWQPLRAWLSSIRRARVDVRRGGWVVEEEYGIYGLRSAIWGYAAKWWAHLEREDLADRCYHGMREDLVRGSGRADLAALVAIRAKRKLRGNQGPSTNGITNTRM